MAATALAASACSFRFQLSLDVAGRARRIQYVDDAENTVAVKFAQFCARAPVTIPPRSQLISYERYQEVQQRRFREQGEKRGGTALALCNLFSGGP